LPFKCNLQRYNAELMRRQEQLIQEMEKSIYKRGGALQVESS
jgi:hypothetical protein